jgi:glycerophosphoryl diester phosphodiesterase
MKIIGHRGAKGLAPENTIASIKAAIKAGVDAVEFDIRSNLDGELFLIHDTSFSRTHGIDKKIADMSSMEVKKIRDSDGNSVPTLTEALQACGSTPAIIEAKNGNWAKSLAKILHSHPKKHIHSVISFNHHELAIFGKECPNIALYVLEHRNPFDAINTARIYGFDGIDINYWTLNPLAYMLAWRHNLKVIVFTVDKTWVAAFLRILYPGIAVTTNMPHIMQHFRPKELRKRLRA